MVIILYFLDDEASIYLGVLFSSLLRSLKDYVVNKTFCLSVDGERNGENPFCDSWDNRQIKKGTAKKSRSFR